jgi:hypothetical protein
MDTQTTIRVPVRRRRWLSVLLGFSVFFAGLAAGVALTIVFALGIIKHIMRHPENEPARITSVLAVKLRLDDNQRQQVLAIMTKHQVQIQAIRRQMRPQFDMQLDQIRAEVDAVLSESQRTHWETMFDQLRERWTPKLMPAPTTEPSTAAASP